MPPTDPHSPPGAQASFKQTTPGLAEQLVAEGGDDMLSQFVKPDFEPKEFVRSVVKRDSVPDDLAHLKQGIAVLESQLREQVVSHHGRLIEQVSHAKDLEELVNTVSNGVDKLQQSIGSVKEAIREPFQTVKEKTDELERLQAAGELIRYVVRIRDLSTKLKKAIASAEMKGDQNSMKDLAQAASFLTEINVCLARGDLEGVDEVDSRRKWFRDTEDFTRTKANKVLLEAVLMRQQQDIGNALQVFQNLDCLKKCVKVVQDEVIKLARNSVASSLDTSTLTTDNEESPAKVKGPRPKTPANATIAAAWKSQLWSRMETLMQTLTGKVGQVWTLHRVLSKKRDAQTHILFLEIVSGGIQKGDHSWSAFSEFWVQLFHGVTAELQACGDKNTFIKGMLSTDFPKLRSLFLDMWDTSRRETDAGQSGAISEEQRLAILNSLCDFQGQYLSRASTRVTESVNGLFASKASGGPVGPAPADVTNLQKAIASTAQSARSDAELSVAIARAIEEAVNLFVKRCDDTIIVEGSDIKALGTTLTMAQTKNMAMYHAACQVQSCLETIESGLAKSGCLVASGIYGRVKTEVGMRALRAVEPMFSALQEAVLFTFVDMHEEILDTPRAPPSEQEEEMENCSAYMKRAKKYIDTFHSRFVQKLSPSRQLKSLQEATAKAALVSFVRNLVLIHPLSEIAKMNLVQDMTTLEDMLGKLCTLKEVGQPYQALRALRPLLFVEDEPLTTLPQRLLEVKGADYLSKQDLVCHVMQRSPASVPPLFQDPPGASRRNAIQAYINQIDSQGPSIVSSRVQGILDSLDTSKPSLDFKQAALTVATSLLK